MPWTISIRSSTLSRPCTTEFLSVFPPCFGFVSLVWLQCLCTIPPMLAFHQMRKTLSDYSQILPHGFKLGPGVVDGFLFESQKKSSDASSRSRNLRVEVSAYEPGTLTIAPRRC